MEIEYEESKTKESRRQSQTKSNVTIFKCASYRFNYRFRKKLKLFQIKRSLVSGTRVESNNKWKHRRRNWNFPTRISIAHVSILRARCLFRMPLFHLGSRSKRAIGLWWGQAIRRHRYVVEQKTRWMSARWWWGGGSWKKDEHDFCAWEWKQHHWKTTSEANRLKY